MSTNQTRLLILGTSGAIMALLIAAGLAFRGKLVLPELGSEDAPSGDMDQTPDAPSLFDLTAPPPESVLQHTNDGPGTTPQVDLPPGMYWVSFRSEASFGAVTPIVDEGQCSPHPLFLDGAGPFVASATYRSTGCRVRFEVGDSDGSWTLAVGAAEEAGLLDVPATFSGDSPAATDVVDLPAGEYHLSLESDSPYSMVVPLVAEGLCLERPVFLETEPGQFDTTYPSTGCQVIFQVSSVTDDWTLRITAED